MANKNFNVDETNYNKFKELNPGNMSQLVNDFIGQWVTDVNAKPIEVAKLELELKAIDKQIRELKNKSYSISVRITNKRAVAKKQVKAATKEELSIEIWANDVIRDAKTNGTYIDLVLRAERAGLTPVNLLISEWNEAKTK